MKRCVIFRGSNTWRCASTSARTRAPSSKLRGAAPKTPVPKRDGIRQQDPAHLQTGRDMPASVRVADPPAKTSSETSAQCLFLEDATPRSTESTPLPSFPLSPLMNPEVQQAKERYSRMKQPPDKLSTRLQQELAKNPFALALASPIRTCGLSNVSLPRYFLQDFKVLSHPTTNVPYFLPASLISNYTRVDERPGQTKSILGLTAYTLANKQSLAMMQDPRKGRGGKSQRAHYKLIARSYLETKPIHKQLMSSKWRPDMEDFVLELLRRRCVERLTELAQLQRGYLVGCEDWEDAASKPSVGAFLWTGGLEMDPKGPPADFATLDLGMAGGLDGGARKRKRKVPAYNLRTLLGAEKLAELSKQLPSGIFTRDVVALKRKKMTVELQLHLWKMQGYVADFNEHLDAGRLASEQDDEDEDDEDDDEGDDDSPNGDDRRSGGGGRGRYH